MGDYFKCHFDPLLRRQGHRCFYCKRQVSRKHDQKHPLKATLDHRLPRCRGGSNHRSNLVVACHECNVTKADMTDSEFVRLLEQRVDDPRVSSEIDVSSQGGLRCW